MSLVKKLKFGTSSAAPTSHESQAPAFFTPVRTENYQPDPKTKWLVIEPDLFPGEEIVIVLKPGCLEEAEKENPDLVIYTAQEINELAKHETDLEFRKKIHAAKKIFGGYVRASDLAAASTV